MIHHKLTNTQDVKGFAVTAGRAEEKVEIAVRGSMSSLHPNFNDYITKIWNIYLSPFIPMNQCNQFLILRRADKSADIYINDFQYRATIVAKKDVTEGQVLRRTHIADMGKLEFPGITINKTDAVILGMRVGWRFVLYFDFTANPKTEKSMNLNVDKLYATLGRIYRNLLFEKEYDILSNNELYSKMSLDGWFPFIELLGEDFEVLSRLYEYDWNVDMDAFLDRFNKERLDDITQSWWRKPPFEAKKNILEAGVDAYLRDDESGYIQCIHVLYPQIEGIMGAEFLIEQGHKPSFSQLLTYIQSKAMARFPSEESLGFPNHFYKYLSTHVFQIFDLETGKVDISRHTTTHGYAKQEDFTRMKALQSILVLNQLFFYI